MTILNPDKLVQCVLAISAALFLLCAVECDAEDKDNAKDHKVRITTGILYPCPASPNCINSYSTLPEHFAAPFSYAKHKDAVKQLLKQIIAAEPRTKLVKEDGNYLHYEFTSLVFRFVDDVEFYFDDQNKVIHFRSASRKGYSDFGVNRKRVEHIRKLIAGKI